MRKEAIDEVMCRRLVTQAKEMLKYSYTPYSGFKVGAALLCSNGKVVGGCNIENAAYGPTNCAERTAFFKAVSEGIRSFEAIAIVGGPDGKIRDFCPPCGVCRQVMMEFCRPDDFLIILTDSQNTIRVYTLAELMPEGFGPSNL